MKTRKANWIGHILCRNYLLKHIIEGQIEGRIEVTGRRGRRRRQLLDAIKERWGFWKVKEETLDRTVWRTGFGRGYEPVVRRIAEWMSRIPLSAVLLYQTLWRLSKRGIEMNERLTSANCDWTQKDSFGLPHKWCGSGKPEQDSKDSLSAHCLWHVE